MLSQQVIIKLLIQCTIFFYSSKFGVYFTVTAHLSLISHISGAGCCVGQYSSKDWDGKGVKE